MRKNDWLILFCTFAFSFLFYQQGVGINFLIFDLVLSSSLFILNKELIHDKKWILSVALSLISGVFILIHGSWLAFWANLISVLLLCALSVNTRSSVLFNLFFGIYSILSSGVFVVLNSINSAIQKKKEGRKNNFLRILTWLIPLVLGLVFFFIYKSANPLFNNFTKKINLDFLSAGWIGFTLLGFLIVYGMVRHQRIHAIDKWENNLPLQLSEDLFLKQKWNEGKAALLLFILLNGMLLFINILDLNYLYLRSGMPENVTHKQFVHNGVGTLVLSILLGISIIIYFFRGNLNFSKENKFLKLLVYAWIFQNLFMIFSTLLRHNLYVFDALLSYKRVLVYFWLALSAGGLLILFMGFKSVNSG
ncbi:MAG: DUF4173 domain-containing protein, partial [Bacteroidia bacterium]|nr:DUF4173 domain-containing protein [Bacteroidia bacterium]